MNTEAPTSSVADTWNDGNNGMTTPPGRANTDHVQIQDFEAREKLNKHSTDNDEGDLQRSDLNESVDGGFEWVKRWWKFKMRGFDDDLERDWWFASTAIPLLAATIAPLANVLSIAALVTYWRENISDGKGGTVPQLSGTSFRDPRWCYWLNVVSLICGFAGNIFLLFNFTGRVRYIIALPASIIFFYIATGILVAITLCMHIYFAPVAPFETYTQGFWYAIIAAVFYFFISMLQMVNLLGYMLGKYPQSFDLTDSQRTLILQTMLFFIWLAGGSAVFSEVEKKYGSQGVNWSFVNSLYFCDVTILTVGFGDLYPTTDIGRGLVFPFSVGGIIFLGLVITSISNFASELSEDKVIKKHIERSRHRTVSRAVSELDEIGRIQSRHGARFTNDGRHVIISPPFNAKKLKSGSQNLSLSVYNRADHHDIALRQRRKSSTSAFSRPIRRRTKIFDAATYHAKKLVILRDEKDRFDAMRTIQNQTHKFKRWYALTLSAISFSLLWAVGAIVFWRCETNTQGMTYFEALYFCYVSLLTIGYGDLAPKSNAGRCFFVVWSLIAVPTMTILVNDLGNTVIDSFKKGTFRFADFTLLPKKGVWREWLDSHPKIFDFLVHQKEKRDMKKRLKEGMKFPGEPGGEAPDPDTDAEAATLHPNFETLSQEVERDSEHKILQTNEALAGRLAVAIRSVASDLKVGSAKRYSFEEWAEVTRLIRFTSHGEDVAIVEEEEDGVLEWDWLGENSPMMVGQTEPEFVLDRLCESLGRYMRRVERHKKSHGIGEGVDLNRSDDVDEIVEQQDRDEDEGGREDEFVAESADRDELKQSDEAAADRSTRKQDDIS
jgi:potassium channel subfamily K